jgi:hypothetical protein
MKQRAFRHLPDDTPELGPFHGVFNACEGYPRVDNGALPDGDPVVQGRVPGPFLLLVADLGDNFAGFLCDGGERLAEGEV